MPDPTSDPTRSAPTAAADDRSAHRPPPRPETSPSPPPPEAPAGPRRPGVLRASLALWLGSVLAGAVGLATALVDYDTVRIRVADAARETDPDLDQAVLDTGVTATITAVLGGAGVLLVVTAVALVLTSRRTRGLRWVLASAGVLTLLMTPLVLSLVVGGTAVDDGAFLVQAGLVLVALVTLFAGPSRRWSHRP